MTGVAVAATAIDAETRAPLPGTWMIATRTICSGFGHCSEACVELRSGQDDNVIPWYRATKDYKWFTYRRGYYDASVDPGRPALSRKRPAGLVPDWDEASARIAYLDQLAVAALCPQAESAQREAIVPFLRELLDEGLALAELPEQLDSLKYICTLHREGFGPGAAPRACTKPLDWRDHDAFFAAASAGDQQALAQWLDGPLDAAQRARRLDPALAIAAANADLPTMQYLIDHHANLQPAFTAMQQVFLGVPLSMAAYARPQQRASTVRRVVRVAGAAPAPPPPAPPPPPDPKQNARVSTEFLLAAGANPNTFDTEGYTPLHRMTKLGDTQMIALLLGHGARVDQQAANCYPACQGWQEVPLQLAPTTQVAEQLLAAGASLEAHDREGTTPLAATEVPEVAALLIQRGANVNAVTRSGWTPLMHWLQAYERRGGAGREAAKPCADIARELVRRGASLSPRSGDGLVALDFTHDLALRAELAALAAARQAAGPSRP